MQQSQKGHDTQQNASYNYRLNVMTIKGFNYK
jgi:hypothetical protein